MPDEGEIEKTLQAYAQKRREQAGGPLELHPATRRLLQGEAARAAPRAPVRAGFWAEVWMAFRQRLAIVSMFAVLAVASAWLFWPGRPRREAQGTSTLLARNEKQFTPSVAPIRQEPAAPAPAATTTRESKSADKKSSGAEIPAPAPGATFDSGLGMDEASRRKLPTLAGRETTPAVSPPAQLAQSEVLKNEPAVAVPAPAASMPPPTVSAPAASSLTGANVALAEGRTRAPDSSDGSAKDVEAAKSRNYAFSDSLSTAKPALDVPPGSPAPAPVARDREMSVATVATAAAPGMTTQHFYRLADAGAGSSGFGGASPAKGVLDNFRLERTGNQLLVVDADGSTYSGFVQSEDLDAAAARMDDISQTATASEKQKATKGLGTADSLKTADGVVSSVGGVVATKPAVLGTYFRVTGTNRVTGQTVVFTGTLTSGATVASASGSMAMFGSAFKNASGLRAGGVGGGGGGGGGGASSAGDANSAGNSSTRLAIGAAPVGAVSPSATGSQVHGRALIGGTNVIEVNSTTVGQ